MEKATTMRFTPQDKALMAQIRERYGCPSDIAAVRLAIRLVVEGGEASAPITPHKERPLYPRG